MAKTFNCPHCEASYSALPTLVGRKVRCSSCKNVFQLQHTGLAIKVEVVAAQKTSSQSALEPVGGRSSHSHSSASAGVPQQASGRPQAVAIRKQTKRIHKMRTSLQDMANKALEDIDNKQSQGKLRLVQGAKKGRGEESIQNMSVVLTSNGDQERKIARKIMIGCSLPLLLITLIIIIFGGTSHQQQALNDFAIHPAAAQRNYPARIHYYLDKMCYASSQGRQQTIITNVNEAQFIGDIRELSSEGASAFFSQFANKTRMHVEQDYLGTSAGRLKSHGNEFNKKKIYIILDK